MDPAHRLARLLARSVRDERVLDAVAAVPRHRFVPPPERTRAY
jgi:protein-L-isoaspartate O-methyltransferase